VVGFLAVVSLVFFKDPDQGLIITNKTTATYGLLFISGFFASAAMILPGISGSLVFLIMGVYPTIMDGLSNLDWLLILFTGMGIFLGILSMSKVIHFFLERYRTAAFAMIIGSVIGSIVVIFPGWPINNKLAFISIATFAIGLFVAYLLGKVEYDEN